jgi:predicted lipoprotein with Yx(FWY)xxD motif
LAALATIPACGSDDDDDTSPPMGGSGTAAGSAGKTSTAGASPTAGASHGGTTSEGGSGGFSHGGSTTGNGGDGGTLLGNAGESAAGQGGDQPGNAGGGPGSTEECEFHTPSENAGGAANGSGGASGAGGADGDSVVLASSKTIGDYLTGGDGYALYVFGSDVPGDCHQPPSTTCVEGSTCFQTWTSFSAGSRALPRELKDEDFGDFVPVAGAAPQTTYHGWPLYRYVGDGPGTVTGQGIATLWHAVRVPFFNVMLMKKKLSDVETVKYISDGRGFAVYTSSADLAATAQQTPHSNCDAECSKAWPPFTLDRFILPSSFEASDFSLFAREGGALQVAYRGKPLYRFAQDDKPGDTHGHGVETFVLADPAL